MKIRAVVFGLFMAAILISVPRSGQAVPLTCDPTPCTLATLISTPGEIIVDLPPGSPDAADKRYGEFFLGSSSIAASDIQVGIGPGTFGAPGLRFAGEFSAGPGAEVIVPIEYTATVVTAGSVIVGIDLDMGPGEPAITGTGSISVGGTVSEIGNLANTATAEACLPTEGGCGLSNFANLPDPTAAVVITLGIHLTGGTDGTATLSFVNLEPIQGPAPPVPEPSSVALLVAGLMLTSAMARRIRRGSR